MHKDNTCNNKPCPTRRDALTWGLWAVAGVLAAAAVWPVYELVSSRRGRKKALKYIPAVPVEDMPEVGVIKVELNLRGGDRPDTRVFIKRDAAGALTVLSATCTHLSCLVNFNRIKGEFICPCHGGKYDIEGRVIAGPPPAPLVRLPVRVEGSTIAVGFML